MSSLVAQAVVAVVAVGLGVGGNVLGGQEVVTRTGEATARLDRLAEATAGEALPPGWSLREVGGASPAYSLVMESDEQLWIRFGTDGAAASQFWVELKEPLSPAGGHLEWRWRVDEPVPGADLRLPGRDDSAARLFVVFGRPGFMSAPRTIFYSWGGGTDRAGFFRSHVSDRLAVLELRGRDDSTGVWLDERRRPARDFREAFGEEPPAITAVGFMIDTDQIGTSASAGLARISWHTRAEEGR